jgi:hypothetical protein
MQRFAAVLVAALVLLSGCGKGNKKANDSIGISDAPAPAGPPSPTTTAAGDTGSTVPGRRIAAPWSAPTSNVANLIRRAGLDVLTAEGNLVHYHSHLDVFVNGAPAPVPADIGIDRDKSLISPLHTHDQSGIIHVESDKDMTFHLGELFVQWDVRLDSTCVGSYCAAATPVAYYVDGTKVTSDPTRIEFARHREIAIVIGTPPASIPAKYEWPENV